MTAVAAAVLGLIVGSFLNVCIARLPEGRSIVRPPSACPACGARIAWRDNIPVLSFALLRGRCRSCGEPIAWRYPIVEAATAALFVAAALRFGLDVELLIALPLLAALVLVTAIDLDHQIIPHVITVPGMAYGLIINGVLGQRAIIACILGVLLGHGIVALIIQWSELLIGEPGMGYGDGGLLALLGACLGWRAMVAALFIAIVIGGLVAVILIVTGRRGRREAIPFGPYIATGGVAGLFWGEDLLGWYLSTVMP